ncbi:YidC/Oxa1 family insertase periplasmic-domain containing protein, partial [Bacillus velezensis]
PQDVVLENESIALTFSTKGAHPTMARLKKYRTYPKQPLDFFSGAGNALAFTLPFDNGRATSDLIFQPTPTTGPDGSKALAFTSDLGGGKSVSLIYTLPKEGYMMNVSVRTRGLQAQSLPVVWQTRALSTEKDVTDERINSQIY